jgi:hypothetical protein
MDLSDRDLRSMVREAIARHARPEAAAPFGARPGLRHASHILLQVPAGSEGDGTCLIEPAVGCTHCGYCRSYGH